MFERLKFNREVDYFKAENKSLSLKLIEIFIKFQIIRFNYILVDDLPLQ